MGLSHGMVDPDDPLMNMIQRLMPDASADEQLTAVENLRWYVRFVRGLTARRKQKTRGTTDL